MVRFMSENYWVKVICMSDRYGKNDINELSFWSKQLAMRLVPFGDPLSEHTNRLGDHTTRFSAYLSDV